MARGSSISRPWAQAQSITVTTATLPQSLLGLAAYGVSVRLSSGSTGTLSGSFALQVTDFGVDESTANGPQSSDWATVASSSQTWAGNTLTWSYSGPGNKWLRVLFTNSGSSGTPTVDINFTGQAWQRG